MSTSEQTAHVKVQADNPSLEIRLLNSNLDSFLRGVGGIDARVPAGLYELQYGVGTDAKSELIALRAGEILEREAAIEYPSIAPVGHSFARGQPSAELVGVLDRLPSQAPRDSGELVVFLRKVASENLETPEDPFIPLGLVSEDGAVVSEFEEDTVRFDARGGQWATAYLELPPGGYALRVMPPARKPDERNPNIVRRAYDQSVWIEKGWQTLIFVPQVSIGAAPQIASVHMVRNGEKWDPASPATLALETMINCLRDGKSAVSERHLALLSAERTRSPILGIVSAHSALAARPPKLDLFDQILGILVDEWPAFPDVRALAPIGEDQRRHQAKLGAAESGEPYVEPPPPLITTKPVTWPPMLLASFLGLVRCDAKWPDLHIMSRESFAERAAVRVLVGGLWSTWEPFGHELQTDAARKQSQMLSQSLGAVGRLFTEVLRRVGRAVTARDWLGFVAAWPADDPASIRLKLFLTSMAERTEAPTIQAFVDGLKASEISLATGLPVSLVQSALATVKEKLAAVHGVER